MVKRSLFQALGQSDDRKNRWVKSGIWERKGEENMSLTIMKNLNKFKVNDSR